MSTVPHSSDNDCRIFTVKCALECREREAAWYIHCISKKNIPDVFSYNSRKHCRIFIIFGRNITKKASNQQMLYFSISPD